MWYSLVIDYVVAVIIFKKSFFLTLTSSALHSSHWILDFEKLISCDPYHVVFCVFFPPTGRHGSVIDGGSIVWWVLKSLHLKVGLLFLQPHPQETNLQWPSALTRSGSERLNSRMTWMMGDLSACLKVRLLITCTHQHLPLYKLCISAFMQCSGF